MEHQPNWDETTQSAKDFPVQRTGFVAAFSRGDVIGERFRIVRKVGEGAMAIVYEAFDEKLGERRALKFAKAGFSRTIPPEASSALRVTHANICRTYEIHTDDTGTPPVDFISMEFLEGETLHSRCQRDALPSGEVLEIAKQLCQGLEAAHRAQVLHRDLKGNNVMLTHKPDGSLRVVITDFGLAKPVSATVLATTSAVAGTPNYVAPERWKNAVATPASDVYALGVILYEMSAGRLPFDPVTPMEVRLTELPDAPSKQRGDCDPRWDAIVLGCLHPDPLKRLPSPAAVLARIERAFAVSHRKHWLAAVTAILLAAGSSYHFRDTIFPPAPIARLAILPLKTSTSPDDDFTIAVRGGLSDIAARLAVLGAASRRVVIIPPEELQNYKADSPALAATRLRATHGLSGEIERRRDLTTLHVAVTELSTGNVLKTFDGEFRPDELAGVSKSLAAVVTSAFHLPAAPEASIKAGAYADYARGLALLRRDLSSYEEAIRHLNAARDIDPHSPLVLAAMAEAYLQKFRTTQDARWLDQASTIAGRAESLHPDSVAVLLALSSIELTGGKSERAMQRLRRAGELEPNNSDVWRQMGTALDSAGRTDEAVAALRKSIQLMPNYFRPHRELGTFYARKGQFREAIDEYRIVTQLAPDLPEGYSDLGAVLLLTENEQEAEGALRKSIGLRETRAALNNLGVLLRYQNRDAEAAPIMMRGLEAGPDDATIRLNLANALQRISRSAEARMNYQRALELARTALLLNPRDSASRARLAYSMARLQMPAAIAADEALQAIALASSDYYTLYWTIMTLETLDRRKDAFRLLAHTSPQQLKDLRRQPDLAAFIKDPRFPKTPNPTLERTSDGRN